MGTVFLPDAKATRGRVRAPKTRNERRSVTSCARSALGVQASSNRSMSGYKFETNEEANHKSLYLGHSPDPDDAFMFYAIAKNKIDLRGYQFEHRLEDIQTLNERARRGELHISAISIHAYAYVTDKYALLPCGASMGDGYGPVVVRRAQRSTPIQSRAGVQRPTPNANSMNEAAAEFLNGKKIAVPGKMTSAFLALRLFLGEFEYLVVPFDQIFDAVKSGRADAGLIIHEGQLTYAQSGFEKIVDLGEWWKARNRVAIAAGWKRGAQRYPAASAPRSQRDHSRKHRLRSDASG